MPTLREPILGKYLFQKLAKETIQVLERFYTVMTPVSWILKLGMEQKQYELQWMHKTMN